MATCLWSSPIKAETLLAIASPHGADLKAQSSQRSAKTLTKPTDTVTKMRRGVTSTILIPPPKYRSAGTADRATKRPAWTLAELGIAAQGIAQVPFLAACYRFAGDASRYWDLWTALRERALNFAQRDQWPTTVMDLHGLDQPYLGHLCILVLDADAQPKQFNARPQLYAEWMRVTPRVWERDLEARFWRLQSVFDAWCSQAAAGIQRRLRDPERGEVDDDFEPAGLVK